MNGRGGSVSSDGSGGWSSGSSSSLPQNLTVDSRSGNQPAEYTASFSIEFTGDFESGNNDEFTAYITSDNSSSGGSGGSGGTGSGSITEDGGYRYGFNGKENDDEVKGEGAQQDYGMRIYDPRLGRFLSVDPLTGSYPMLTPYQFASNRPIDGIDLDGKEWSVATVDRVTTFTVKIRVYNESKALKKAEDVNKLLNGGLDKKGNKIEGYKDYAEQAFAKDFGTDKFRLNIQFEIMQGPSCDYNLNNEFQLILRDVSSTDNGDGTVSYSGGATYVGQTQKNHMFSTLSVDGSKLTDRKLLFRNFLHELLHTGGLNHPWKKDLSINDFINNPDFLKKLDSDKKFRKFIEVFFNVDGKKLLNNIKEASKKNIMNSDEPRGDVPIDPTHNPSDNDIRKSQYKKIEKTVSEQQSGS